MALSGLRENFVFIREFLAEFQNTGTIWPTSVHAARALTSPIRDQSKPINILELGPGTGSVTVQILKDMRDHDRLTICEINPRFMKALKEALKDNPDFQRRKSQIDFRECPAQDLPEDRQYEVIVCALPFLNFDLATVEEIFTKLRKLSNPNTIMTYYEYIGLRSINKTFSRMFGKERIHLIDQFLTDVQRRCQMTRKQVWQNMLPINVYRLEIGISISNGQPGIQ